VEENFRLRLVVLHLGRLEEFDCPYFRLLLGFVLITLIDFQKEALLPPCGGSPVKVR